MNSDNTVVIRPPMSPERRLAVAVRCQLLTGSYEGATRSCGCESPSLCHLSDKDRSELNIHPKVVMAAARNLAEFLS